MGACGSKPKVLREKLRRSSRKNSSKNSNCTGAASSLSSKDQGSSLKKDEKESLSLSADPDKDEAAASSKEDKDVDETIVTRNEDEEIDEPFINSKKDDTDANVSNRSIDNQREMPPDDDDLDNHDHVIQFDSSSKDYEADDVVNEVRTAIKEDENVTQEELTFKEEVNSLSPTRESQEDHTSNKSSTEVVNLDECHPRNSPPSLTSKNDFVEMDNSSTNSELDSDSPSHAQNNPDETTNQTEEVVQDPDSDSDSDSPPLPIDNDVVETASISEDENDFVHIESPTGIAQIHISSPPSYTSEHVVVAPTSKAEGNKTLKSTSSLNQSGTDLLTVDNNSESEPMQANEPVKTQSPDRKPLSNKSADKKQEQGGVLSASASFSTYAF